MQEKLENDISKIISTHCDTPAGDNQAFLCSLLRKIDLLFVRWVPSTSSCVKHLLELEFHILAYHFWKIGLLKVLSSISKQYLMNSVAFISMPEEKIALLSTIPPRHFWLRTTSTPRQPWTKFSPAVGDFYVTGIEIWVGFGPVGITEKENLGSLWATFEASFFM